MSNKFFFSKKFIITKVEIIAETNTMSSSIRRLLVRLRIGKNSLNKKFTTMRAMAKFMKNIKIFHPLRSLFCWLTKIDGIILS